MRLVEGGHESSVASVCALVQLGDLLAGTCHRPGGGATSRSGGVTRTPVSRVSEERVDRGQSLERFLYLVCGQE